MLIFFLSLNKIHSFIPAQLFVNDCDLALQFHHLKDSSHAALDYGLVLKAVVFLLWGQLEIFQEWISLFVRKVPVMVTRKEKPFSVFLSSLYLTSVGLRNFLIPIWNKHRHTKQNRSTSSSVLEHTFVEFSLMNSSSNLLPILNPLA